MESVLDNTYKKQIWWILWEKVALSATFIFFSASIQIFNIPPGEYCKMHHLRSYLPIFCWERPPDPPQQSISKSISNWWSCNLPGHNASLCPDDSVSPNQNFLHPPMARVKPSPYDGISNLTLLHVARHLAGIRCQIWPRPWHPAKTVTETLNDDKLKINEVWKNLFFTLMSHFGAIFLKLPK